MNTNLIIQNVLRKITKQDNGGYIIVELGNKSPKYPFTVPSSPNTSDSFNFTYKLYPGINYIYVPYKQIQFAQADEAYKSLTYINFDLVDNIWYAPNTIVSFINCKKLNIPYIVDPHCRPIICNNNALINLYKEKCADPNNVQATTDICLESNNFTLDKTKQILLYNTKYTDIYIGDCITSSRTIATYDGSVNNDIKNIHIDKFDKDNIKLYVSQEACDRVIIIDDSTRKKYKPIYSTDKTYFTEIVNGTFQLPFYVKLVFTANTDTSVKVYFTKKSFDAKNPDDTISLTANQEKTTTYVRKNIYTFIFNDTSYITYAKVEGALLNCAQLFNNCSNLTTLDVSKLDTSKVTDISNMFRSCSNLTTMDVSNLNVSNVTNMNSMFYDCSKLSTIGPVDTASGWQHTPTDYASMFFNCPATPKPSWYK